MVDRPIPGHMRKLSELMRPMTAAVAETLKSEAGMKEAPMVTLVVWGTEADKWVLYTSNAERQTVIEGLEELLSKLKADQGAGAPPVPLHERQ